jgi:hypothetical protein
MFGDDEGAGGLDASLNIESKEGWSASGTMICLDANRTVSLQQVFKVAGIYTVQFNIFTIDPQPDPLIPVPILAEALIEWSVSGNPIKRRVSVANGVSISGLGEGVRVTVKDVSGSATLIGVRYGIAITVAKGVRASFLRPPTLDRETISSVPAGGTALFAIPLDAGANSVEVLVGSSGAFPIIADQAIQVIQQAGATLFKVYDPRQENFVPLAAGATDILLTNHTAADIFASVTFGIDG